MYSKYNSLLWTVTVSFLYCTKNAKHNSILFILFCIFNNYNYIGYWRGYGHSFIKQRERWGTSPPPPKFQTKFISMCNSISATNLLEPQKPPEVTSERLKLKHFLQSLWSIPPDPQSSMLHIINSFTSNKKSFKKPWWAYNTSNKSGKRHSPRPNYTSI